MKDWRLQDQEDYLMNKSLIFTRYEKYRDDWDHDHCEFCNAKFSTYEGDLHDGYATVEKYYWICQECYHDFKSIFNWKLINELPNN